MLFGLALSALYAVSVSVVVLLQTGVLASPLPFPLALMATNRGRLEYARNSTSELWLGDTSQHMYEHQVNDQIIGRDNRRGDASLDVLIRIYRSASIYAQKLSTSGDPSDCISNLLGLRENFKGFPGILAELAADKGLANYDRTNDLETTLKNIINLIKESLNFVDTEFKDDPVIGSIIYEIKCIVDESLDAVENLTDAALNLLAPLLPALKDTRELARATSCHLGIKLFTLCI